jgi:hypothetical protein
MSTGLCDAARGIVAVEPSVSDGQPAQAVARVLDAHDRSRVECAGSVLEGDGEARD